MKSKNITSMGTDNIVAIILGIKRYFFESTANVSIASICSVTLIVPSSADIEDIALEITIRDVNTGPNSLDWIKIDIP